MKIRIDGDMPTRLKTGELVNWLSPVWSPGGNNLLFSAREAKEPMFLVEYRMVLMNLDTSQKHAFVLPGVFEKDWSLFRLVWGPDGSQLILSVGEVSGEKDHQHLLYLIDTCQRNRNTMDGRCDTKRIGSDRVLCMLWRLPENGLQGGVN